MVPPPSTSADRLGSILPEPLNTGDALERYKQVAQKVLIFWLVLRDVNGDPIPANPWEFPLLGYWYGTKIVPMGTDMGQNLHPLGKWVWEAITRTRLPMGISYVYTCHVCMNELMPSRPPSPARQRTRPQVLAQQGN